MHADFVILIVVFSYLRKKLHTQTLLPYWDTVFKYGLFVSIALMVIDITIKPLQPVMPWIAHIIFIVLTYLVLKKKEFQAVKPILYAVLPLILLSFLRDATELINKNFYTSSEKYFDTAGVFSFVWLIAMLIINNRQQKALLKEQLKTAEREKEFRASESMKAILEVQVAERTIALTKQKEALEQALFDLKAVQKQLIQSEKLASLGELTAGIAHEIQNPLNFVNNFSELSVDLAKEINEAMDNEEIDKEFVKELISDLTSNQQKINHHGKRAASIVTGMLQYTRTSTGKKEPTELNALADEYFRLAYHGLRAKDPNFNATMVTNFDSSIGKVELIPQDMGRVLLNLINNAFYAVQQRADATRNEAYEPTVTVSTQKINSQIIIKVQDSGMGIPEAIKDKIFQPFFTTKPTGQGTGLGLSLAYDIVVKGHGGTMEVETQEGEGTTFSIILPFIKQ